MYLGEGTTWSGQILAVEEFLLLSHVVSHDLQYDYEAAHHDFLCTTLVPKERQVLPDAHPHHVSQLPDECTQLQHTLSEQSCLAFLFPRDLNFLVGCGVIGDNERGEVKPRILEESVFLDRQIEGVCRENGICHCR